MGRLDAKVAIVTGAGTGIGFATATRLVEEGAEVTIAEFDAKNGEGAAEVLGEAAQFIQHDVRDEASWQSLMDKVTVTHGRPDILVNNAGILATEQNQHLATTDLDQWRAIQTVNVEGVFLGCKYGVAAMTSGGGREKGVARKKGVACRWNDGRGFGFIKPDDGGEDVFCHVSAIQDGNMLRGGDEVSFEPVFDSRKGKYRAGNVTGGCDGRD